MTEALFRDDSYLVETKADVLFADNRGIALDRTVFYPQGGGQAGDQGVLVLADGGTIPIVNTVYDADRKTILHAPAEGANLPAAGASVIARIDWDRRLKRMRAHTALHLLSVVLPYPVTGGSVGDAEGRLDFNSGEAVLDKAEVERRLNELIAIDAPVSQRWITDAELEANASLIKTMSVKPPTGPAGSGSSPSKASTFSLAGEPYRQNRRNRPRLGDPDRKEGQDQPPRAHRARLALN